MLGEGAVVGGGGPVGGAAQGQGLGAGTARSGERDGRSATEWRRAITTCEACPLLAQCRADTNSAIECGAGPRRMILAATADDNHGKAVDRDRLELYEAMTRASRPRSTSTGAA